MEGLGYSEREKLLAEEGVLMFCPVCWNHPPRGAVCKPICETCGNRMVLTEVDEREADRKAEGNPLENLTRKTK